MDENEYYQSLEALLIRLGEIELSTESAATKQEQPVQAR
jgi:hypothetical protein